MAERIDRGPAPASALPWVAGPFPLGSGMSVIETRDANGAAVAQVFRGRSAEEQRASRADEATVVHRVNGWDALVERCETAEREREEAERAAMRLMSALVLIERDDELSPSLRMLMRNIKARVSERRSRG